MVYSYFIDSLKTERFGVERVLVGEYLVIISVNIVLEIDGIIGM